MTTVLRQNFSQKSSHDAVASLPGNATPFWHLFIASSLTGKHPDRAYINETMVDGKTPPFSIFLNCILCRYLSFERHSNSLSDLLGTSLLSYRIHPWQFSWTSMEFFESQELKRSLSYSRRSAETPESKICQTLFFRRGVGCTMCLCKQKTDIYWTVPCFWCQLQKSAKRYHLI